MTSAPRIFGALLGIVFARSATCQIKVDLLEGSDWETIAQLAAGSNVTILDVGSRTYRVYTVDPTVQSIGTLSIESSNGATPVLFVGQGLTEPSEILPLPTAGALTVGAISYSGGRPRLQLRVNESAGEIYFWEIVRLDFGGTIVSNITHNPVGYTGPTPPRLGVIHAIEIGSTSASPTICADLGDIGRITTTYNAYVDVDCATGSIGSIEAGVGLVGGHVAGKKIQAQNGSIGDIIAF